MAFCYVQFGNVVKSGYQLCHHKLYLVYCLWKRTSYINQKNNEVK